MASRVALLLPTRVTSCKPAASASPADGCPGHVCGPPQEVVQDTGSLHTGIHIGRADLKDSSEHTPLKGKYQRYSQHSALPRGQPVIENPLPAGEIVSWKGRMRSRRSEKASSATNTCGCDLKCSAPGSRASCGRPRVPSRSAWPKVELASAPPSLVLP